VTGHWLLVKVFTACRIASAVLATAIPSIRLSHAGIVNLPAIF